MKIMSRDRLGSVRVMPKVVVKVISTEEVSNVMRYAYENNIPVTPRGAGTGLVGAAVPIYEWGELMDVSGMNRKY